MIVHLTIVLMINIVKQEKVVKEEYKHQQITVIEMKTVDQEEVVIISTCVIISMDINHSLISVFMVDLILFIFIFLILKILSRNKKDFYFLLCLLIDDNNF